MQREDMDRLIEEHLKAEKAGDPAGSVAMYTADIIHDVVGSPTGPLHRPEAARGFYEMLTRNITTEQMDLTHAWYGDDCCTIEHRWLGTVPGEFLGIPRHGRQISFRMLHIFEFKHARISRENVWLDGNAIVTQLTTPSAATPPQTGESQQATSAQHP
jgi:predicted ester cyclase